jgi:hypothetical protein
VNHGFLQTALRTFSFGVTFTQYRTGGKEKVRECLCFNEHETTIYMFGACRYFEKMPERDGKTSYRFKWQSLGTTYENILYPKDIIEISHEISTRKKVVSIIDAYIWSGWTHPHTLTLKIGGCQNMFMVHMKNLSFDNG